MDQRLLQMNKSPQLPAFKEFIRIIALIFNKMALPLMDQSIYRIYHTRSLRFNAHLKKTIDDTISYR